MLNWIQVLAIVYYAIPIANAENPKQIKSGDQRNVWKWVTSGSLFEKYAQQELKDDITLNKTQVKRFIENVFYSLTDTR